MIAPRRAPRAPLLAALLFAASVLGVSVLCASRAHAQPPASRDIQRQAKKHYRVAKTLEEIEEYADAAREYHSAYQLSKRPILLFNAAVMSWEARNYIQSLAWFREYITRAPENEHARAIAAAKSYLDRYRRERAAAYVVRAQARLDQKSYRAAAQDYERAYVLLADPDYLFLAGRLYHRAGDGYAARERLRAYLDRASNTASPKSAPRKNTLKKNASRKDAPDNASKTSIASETIRSIDAAEALAAARRRADQAEHERARRAQRWAAAAAERRVARRRPPSWLSYTALATSLALSGGAVYLDRASSQTFDRFEAELPRTCPSGCPERDLVGTRAGAVLDRARSQQTMARIGYATAATTLIGVVGLHLLGRRRDARSRSRTTAWMLPRVRSDEVGLELLVRFGDP